LTILISLRKHKKEKEKKEMGIFFLPDLEGNNVSDKKTITMTAFLSPFGSFLDE
jgi:hypothetical protein